MVEGESSCFFHPQKKAVVPCGGCGRFLCALCDCQLGKEHLCPACLETGKTKGKISALEHRRTRYDSIALTLAVLPMLPVFPTLITAPMVLFVVIRYWNKPRSFAPVSRARLILASMLAVLQITGWVAWFSYHH